MMHDRNSTAILCAWAILAGAGGARAGEITSNTVWQGNIVVREKIVFSPRAALTIKPQASVFFEAQGELVCEGPFRAQAASFAAAQPLSGKSRLTLAGGGRFQDCAFSNLVTESKRFHNAFLSIRGGPVAIKNCRFEGCSAAEIVHGMEPSVDGCIFDNAAGTALALFHCTAARITGNVFQGGGRTAIMLKLNHSSGSRVTQNRFCGSGTAIELYRASVNNLLVANDCFDNTHGITLHPGADNNVVLACLIDGARAIGVRILGGTENLARNCVIWRAGTGVHLGAREAAQAAADISIINSIFARCGAAIFNGLSSNASGEIAHNAFWENQADLELGAGSFRTAGNLFANPLFVAPENGNFRLQLRAFDHPVDSPLGAAGIPAGCSIGLFPAVLKQTEKE